MDLDWLQAPTGASTEDKYRSPGRYPRNRTSMDQPTKTLPDILA